jgi:aryl-alcohol dehydrogenase-like predicted oxidoreductase
LNRLALGTVQLGMPYGIANLTGQVSHLQAKAMLQLALANSIDTLDTAMSYGDSEACLGKIGTKSFKLITKLPALPNDCEDVCAWVQQQVATSLARLGVTTIYGLLIHRPEDLLGQNGAELHHALQLSKDNGQVKKIGISIYSPAELQLLLSRYRFDLVQAPFNLIDRRLYTSGWMRRLRDEGIEIHTRSAFLQGLLLMAQADIPAKFSPWNNLWQNWRQWLDDRNLTALQTCLAFSLSFPEIDRVIVGADSTDQLMQIVSSENRKFISDFPNLQSEDESLINPVNWSKL